MILTLSAVVSGERRWVGYLRKSFALGERIRGEGRIKEGPEVAYPKGGVPVDWLAYAVESLGGPTAASRAIGVSRFTIYKWLENGLDSANFGYVITLAREANIPLEYLAQRKGPSVDLSGQRA